MSSLGLKPELGASTTVLLTYNFPVILGTGYTVGRDMVGTKYLDMNLSNSAKSGRASKYEQ